MILPPVKSPLVESVVKKIFPDPVSKRSALSRLSLISFWILMGLVPFSVLLVNRPGKVWIAPKAEESCAPQTAFLTNVHSRGFSISWVTAGTCRGFLVWNLSPTGAGTSRGDDRTIDSAHPNGDLNWTSSIGTHYVTVPLGARPAEGKVYLKVYSGDKNYEGSLDQLVPEDPSNPRRIVIQLPTDPIYNPAQLPSPTNTPGAYSLEKDAFSECPNGKLATSCSGTNEKVCAADATLCCHKACFRPYPLWGEFKRRSGPPIEGAIVYITMGLGQRLSNTLSTLTNSQGRWTLELANAHKILGEYALDKDGSKVSAELFTYNTDKDASGSSQNPDYAHVVIEPGKLPHQGQLLEAEAQLHSVIDARSCALRNTCSDHGLCPMEFPSPVCITLQDAPTAPTCIGLTLDKIAARADETVTATLKINSGSSGFKEGGVLLHVATPAELGQNNQHYLGPLTYFNGKTGEQTTTFSFVPSNFNVGSGANIVWLTIENTNSQACTDRPVEYPVGRPDWPLCGCGAKNLTVTAADAPQISEVRPNRGLRGTEVNVTVTGTKLHPNVTYKLARGETKIDGAINATPAPSATSVSVKFNIPASATTGNWNLVATKGTSTASYPFIIVDSTEATVVTFFVELQGLDKSTSPRRQLKINVGNQDYVVESLPQAQGRYVGAFVLPSSVTGLKEFKVWEPEVRLKRKFSGTVNAGDVNYYDWSGKKILAGDFDGNNKITLADFTGPQGILKPLQTGNKISLPITEALKKYDVNGDSALNVLDISLVLLNFSGLEVPGE